MSKIAIVFHSGYGHTKRMAEAVADGAKGELVAIDAEGNLTDAQWAELEDALAALALAAAPPITRSTLYWAARTTLSCTPLDGSAPWPRRSARVPSVRSVDRGRIQARSHRGREDDGGHE